MIFISFTLIFALMIGKGVETRGTTSLTTCVTGAISLPGKDPSSSMKRSTWKAKYQDGDWIVAGHCVHLKGCTKDITVLPDGTRVRIGSNGSLIVERRSNQTNTAAQFQFLFENSSKRRRIFKVHFTLYCIYTRAGANLNVSQAVEELFSKEDLEEVYLFDANGTQFAQIHSNKGASLSLRNEGHSPMTAYLNRLRIEQGSLIFHEINQEDDETTIILEALLNSEQTSFGALSTKTMRIFVCNSSESIGRAQSSTSLSSKRLGSDYPPSSSSTTGLYGQTAKTSSDLAWYKQPWAIILLSLVAVIITGIVISVILLIKKNKRRSSESLSSDVP